MYRLLLFWKLQTEFLVFQIWANVLNSKYISGFVILSKTLVYSFTVSFIHKLYFG